MTKDRPHRLHVEGTVDEVVQRISDREPRVRRARARYELVNRILKGITAVCALVAVGLLIYLAGSANAAADAVRDCTEPGGTCYERSQAQQAAVVGQIVKAQQQAVQTGSAPSRENLNLTRQNTQKIQVILGILDTQYPEAAAAVRAELSKEGK